MTSEAKKERAKKRKRTSAYDTPMISIVVDVGAAFEATTEHRRGKKKRKGPLAGGACPTSGDAFIPPLQRTIQTELSYTTRRMENAVSELYYGRERRTKASMQGDRVRDKTRFCFFAIYFVRFAPVDASVGTSETEDSGQKREQQTEKGSAKYSGLGLFSFAK